MRLTTGEVISYDKKSNWDIIIKKNAVKSFLTHSIQSL